MDPRVREDDEKKDRKKKQADRSEKEKVRKQRMRENTNSTVSHKNSAHPRHAPLPSFPCTRESIHPRTPDVAFGNVLATT
ncbi:hypothetical protein FOB71_09200 [Vibrio vulnificus]|nr:hypothetical protein AOT11_12765 [Vibrio vulnificus NBRC 15645 = ATCC 27562]QET75174.1 hypothetical protein FOB71_09200 [Vibrio vulnificus]